MIDKVGYDWLTKCNNAYYCIYWLKNKNNFGEIEYDYGGKWKSIEIGDI